MSQRAADDERDRHRNDVRLAVAAREYPRTLVLGGAVLVFFTILTAVATQLTDPSMHHPMTYATYSAMAVVLFTGGWLLSTDALALPVRPWVFAAVGVLMAKGLYVNVAIVTEPYSYSIIFLLLCVSGGVTLAWRPYLVEAALILTGGLAVLLRWPFGPALNWFMLTLGAAAVGAILVNVRLRTVDELADATAETQRLAVTDQLTGILNRHGLMERVPGLWSTANRLGQGVFVVFVDIRGLKQANDRYGHEFGDRAITAASRAVVKSVRTGDLVARWGGDELIVIGIGALPEAEAFDSRLQGQHEWTGEDKARWSGELSVGFAAGQPSIDSVDDIISRADHDMYRRRLPE